MHTWKLLDSHELQLEIIIIMITIIMKYFCYMFAYCN